MTDARAELLYSPALLQVRVESMRTRMRITLLICADYVKKYELFTLHIILQRYCDMKYLHEPTIYGYITGTQFILLLESLLT